MKGSDNCKYCSTALVNFQHLVESMMTSVTVSQLAPLPMLTTHLCCAIAHYSVACSLNRWSFALHQFLPFCRNAFFILLRMMLRAEAHSNY